MLRYGHTALVECLQCAQPKMAQRRNDIRHLRGSIISRCWVLPVHSHDDFVGLGLGLGVRESVLKPDLGAG